MRYVAFLRGINVGKHQRVTMSRLREVLTGGGLDGVTTYIQSGNLAFSSDEDDSARLANEIEACLASELGFSAATAVRSVEHLRELLDRQPYGGLREQEDTRHWMAFATRPVGDLPLPYRTPKGDLEVVARHGDDFACLVHLLPGRSNGVPQFEKDLGCPVTMRGWAMLEGMATKFLELKR